MTVAFNIQTLSCSPRLHVIDDFLSDDEIAHVLRLAENPESLAPGLVPDRSQAGLSFEMPVGRDSVLTGIRARLAELLGFGNDMDSSFRFRRYTPGEGHPQHTDAFAANGSELIVTALIGLVAPERGGETDFPLAANGPVAVPHRRGRLVLWYNHTPDGEVDQQSAHAGSRVEAGEKTTLTAFVYKPTYYAASPFPAVPRPVTDRRIVCLHAGRPKAELQAWLNAAEWRGFTAEVWDARSSESVSAADVFIPVDLSPSVRRVLTAQYRHGWTSVFPNAPQRCEDVPLFLARRGFPVRTAVPCESAELSRLANAVSCVGGFPVEAWVDTWIAVHDTENLSRLILRSQALGQSLRIRAPLPPAGVHWVAVVDNQCIGPSASPAVEQMAIRAVLALCARTGIVEYVVDGTGAAALIGVNAPAELSQLPSTWWSKYCLAVIDAL